MRICITTNEVYEPKFGQIGGGVPVAVRTLTDEFRKMGHDVFVITAQKGKQRPVEVLSNGTVVLIDWLRRKENKFHNIMRYLHVPRWKAYELVDPDVFNLHMEGNWQYWSYHYMPRTPKVVSLQYPVDKEQGDLSLKSSKVLHTFKYANRITTASTCFMDEFLSEVPFLKEREITLIHNPINVPEKNEYIKKPKDVKVLWLHRIIPRKQPEKFYDLAKDFPDVTFQIAGRGDLSHIEKMPKLDNLEILGYVSHEKKTKLYKEASIFACTSRGEGLPVVFQEALSFKCALLSNETVNPENIVGKFGVVAKNYDFKKALEKLLGSDYKKSGQNGFRYITKEHEPKKIAKKYIEVYESAMKK
jgi:glycosyltransferase involved in cell wall biosynthesis